MELRRLGFVNKPCHVVPNHMLAQYTAEFVRLYPNASVLMASKEDLEGDRRRELVSRIATGDWDAVVITHSSFERIKMSPQFTETFIKEIIHEIEMAVRAEKSNDRSNRIIKQLEAMKKNWAVRLEKLLAKLSTLFSVWRNQRYANESEVGRLPMMIEALEKKIGLYAQDMVRIEPQTMQGMAMELAGRKIVGPDAAGDALRGLVKTAKEEVRTGSRMIERIVGRFGGFDLGIFASRGEETPSLYLAGHCLYNAEPYQTGPALVAAVLAALGSVGQLHADAQAQLETRRKRLEDIQLELARTFEHEGRLTDLLVRQRALLKQLDLDKDEAGSGKVDAEEARQAA